MILSVYKCTRAMCVQSSLKSLTRRVCKSFSEQIFRALRSNAHGSQTCGRDYAHN